jgi:hypothetical protein
MACVRGIAATITVLLVYLIGLRLFRRQAPAALAAFLLAVDGAFIVQARTSMLDIYLALFVVLGAWLLVVDRQRVAALDAQLLAAGGDTKLDRLPHRDRRFLNLAGDRLRAGHGGQVVRGAGARRRGARHHRMGARPPEAADGAVVPPGVAGRSA